MQLRILSVWCRVLYVSFWKYVTSLLVENILPKCPVIEEDESKVLNTRHKKSTFF